LEITMNHAPAAVTYPRLSPAAAAWLAGPIHGVVIDNQSRPGNAPDWIELVDPGTGRAIGGFTAADRADVHAAVASAQRAYDDGRWSGLDPELREQHLSQLADLLERDLATIAQIESLDTGKPLADARIDVAEAVSVLRYYTGWATKVEGVVIPAPQRFLATGTREPLGVCGAITPWNYPLPILMYKLAPALACGNTFVAKPSELASLSTLYLSQLCAEAGLPPGVVNVVCGAGATGAELAATPGLAKLAFTGSTQTGKAVMRAAAERTTKVSLELGGKSPHIVFADANIDAAIDSVMEGIWTNTGQVCVAGSRLIIDQRIHDDFVAELLARTRRLVIGHGLDPDTTLGPVISQRQQHRITDMIEAAVADGAIAHRASAPPLDGYFVAPTVLTVVPRGHTVERDEVFGPVLTVLPFSTEDEAMAIANDTPYGLAAGVWSTNVDVIHRVARKLRAGTVWANCYGVFHPTLPFGGVKSSGFGRELGSEAIRHYTELKTTVIGIASG
jgi:acyl-CoA reductase-like NAD-dependent aldehyde dehydrogenase